ncbi:uncharacterized protein CANTADRAFT_23044 [Suhomyces tanzawaensis NRRL Y-17324]|uniref:Ketopantoate reductase C-terminal domain-containing protein n=1 Tax=Suhomyces tanzawaensis NRRL Y-17324 TaxID=984487 RepID=A0A1E4SEJ1_9ASCO|nr:uncharacterized protein CANTADRAFT_23044 [Suhomyces tanzawaensis NRRL Y-17324]ODV77927.1 hypothetical protein CANTADRAFT_23044 [Suhomyces tanzawaensis NRRL Y-17324]
MLLVGTSPNLAFYAWRLSSLTTPMVVNPSLDPAAPVTFTSPSLAPRTTSFHPQIYPSIKATPPSSHDIVIIAASSLQDFQTTCTDLVPLVTENTLIIVESSGYINLEPFVQMSFPPKLRNIYVASIMNESDVRITGRNSFHHSLRNSGDSRIYLGTTMASSKDTSRNIGFQKMFQMLQSVLEDSQGAISLLRSVNPKEFMTYQWKLALPRIAFWSLSIIFESEFPEKLATQILCKPLISGIINECFKIIKKMDCKLVKGSESEANILRGQLENFPVTKNNADFMNSNSLLYNFSNGYDLEVDLLLLQPILLGDDNSIRTPYLENLYSMLCQYVKVNDGKSIFFEKKDGQKKTSKDSAHASAVNKDLADKMQQLKLLNGNIADKTQEIKAYDSNLKQQQVVKIELENTIVQNEIKLQELSKQVKEAERSLNAVQMTHASKLKELDTLQNSKPATPPTVKPQETRNTASVSPPRIRNSVQKNRESVQPNDNLEDLADIAMYGANLNSDSSSKSKTASSRSTPQVRDNSFSPVVQQQAPQSLHSGSQGGSQHSSQQDFSSQGVKGYVPNGPQQNGYLQNDDSQFQSNQNYPQPHQQGQNPNSYYRGQTSLGHQPAQSYSDDQGAYPSAPENFVNTQAAQRQYHPSQYPNAPQHAPVGYQQSPIEQLPPHGLPSNGLPSGQFPPNLRGSGSIVSNVNRYQQYQNGMNPNGPIGQSGPQAPGGYQGHRQRVSSGPQSVHSSYYEGANGFNQPVSFNNAAPIDPMVEQRFKNNPKRSNRRSAFPQMNGNLDGLDMGGRGGMPMSGSITNQQKHKSMSQLPPANFGHMMQRKSMNNSNNLVIPPLNGSSSQNFLQPPVMNDSNASSNSSTNSNDTPKTSNSGDHNEVSISIPVPQVDAKPLGTIGPQASLTPEKKKRGFFGKKK